MEYIATKKTIPMIKNFTIDGVINCSIILTENAERKVVTGTNASTHDDYSKQVSVHICRGYVADKEVIMEKFNRWEPKEIVDAVGKVEAAIHRYVTSEKDKKDRKKELDEIFKKLGF